MYYTYSPQSNQQDRKYVGVFGSPGDQVDFVRSFIKRDLTQRDVKGIVWGSRSSTPYMQYTLMYNQEVPQSMPKTNRQQGAGHGCSMVGAIFVFDTSNENAFDEIKRMVSDEISRLAANRRSVTILIVGLDRKPKERKIRFGSMLKFARANGCLYSEYCPTGEQDATIQSETASFFHNEMQQNCHTTQYHWDPASSIGLKAFYEKLNLLYKQSKRDRLIKETIKRVQNLEAQVAQGAEERAMLLDHIAILREHYAQCRCVQDITRRPVSVQMDFEVSKVEPRDDATDSKPVQPIEAADAPMPASERIEVAKDTRQVSHQVSHQDTREGTRVKPAVQRSESQRKEEQTTITNHTVKIIEERAPGEPETAAFHKTTQRRVSGVGADSEFSHGTGTEQNNAMKQLHNKDYELTGQNENVNAQVTRTDARKAADGKQAEEKGAIGNILGFFGYGRSGTSNSQAREEATAVSSTLPQPPPPTPASAPALVASPVPSPVTPFVEAPRPLVTDENIVQSFRDMFENEGKSMNARVNFCSDVVLWCATKTARGSLQPEPQPMDTADQDGGAQPALTTTTSDLPPCVEFQQPSPFILRGEDPVLRLRVLEGLAGEIEEMYKTTKAGGIDFKSFKSKIASIGRVLELLVHSIEKDVEVKDGEAITPREGDGAAGEGLPVFDSEGNLNDLINYNDPYDDGQAKWQSNGAAEIIAKVCQTMDGIQFEDHPYGDLPQEFRLAAYALQSLRQQFDYVDCPVGAMLVRESTCWPAAALNQPKAAAASD